jgi:glutathionylspermidine synthase
MQRISISPRTDWQKKLEEIGFGFHTINGTYWNESAYYLLSEREVLNLETATQELYEMCLTAVQYVIDNKMYHLFGIPEHVVPVILKSWNDDAPAIYGRFDFGYKDGQIKMFEFNADTPTSLFEAGVVQWKWLEDFAPQEDQFNSIHEKLVDYWLFLSNYIPDKNLYFTCVKGNLEDLTTTEYMRDCAAQSGKFNPHLIFIDDIGFDGESFVDVDGAKINNIFKLYPWEWLCEEEFGKHVDKAMWIEPAWKMILSNKAILPVLWSLFPNHPLLLESYFDSPHHMQRFVKKPLLSREGANIDIFHGDSIVESSTGVYSDGKFIYQEYFDLESFSGNFPVIGSWVIGQEPAGIGIREDNGRITSNNSQFVPHLFKKII